MAPTKLKAVADWPSGVKVNSTRSVLPLAARYCGPEACSMTPIMNSEGTLLQLGPGTLDVTLVERLSVVDEGTAVVLSIVDEGAFELVAVVLDMVEEGAAELISLVLSLVLDMVEEGAAELVSLVLVVVLSLVIEDEAELLSEELLDI